MARAFKELREKMSPAAQARSTEAAEQMIRDLALDELREARSLTQKNLAQILNCEQSAVSKLERRTDMYVSTLQTVIKAMGGDLEIRAVFPNGTVRINQFQAIDGSGRLARRHKSA